MRVRVTQGWSVAGTLEIFKKTAVYKFHDSNSDTGMSAATQQGWDGWHTFDANGRQG